MRAGSAAVRPWGPAPWLFSRLTRKWSVLGCLGAEERSLGVLDFLHNRGQVVSALLAEVRPLAGSRHYQETEARLRERRASLGGLAQVSTIQQVELFSSDEKIVAIADSFAASASPHVILDISALPKRFFFPFLKRLLRSQRVETIVATYTVPERYGTGDLAEDHQPFTHLPLFGPSAFPERKPEIVIVSAGFMKLGLADLLEPFKAVSIRTILPFPPRPAVLLQELGFCARCRKGSSQRPS